MLIRKPLELDIALEHSNFRRPLVSVSSPGHNLPPGVVLPYSRVISLFRFQKSIKVKSSTYEFNGICSWVRYNKSLMDRRREARIFLVSLFSLIYEF